MISKKLIYYFLIHAKIQPKVIYDYVLQFRELRWNASSWVFEKIEIILQNFHRRRVDWNKLLSNRFSYQKMKFCTLLLCSHSNLIFDVRNDKCHRIWNDSVWNVPENFDLWNQQILISKYCHKFCLINLFLKPFRKLFDNNLLFFFDSFVKIWNEITYTILIDLK